MRQRLPQIGEKFRWRPTHIDRMLGGIENVAQLIKQEIYEVILARNNKVKGRVLHSSREWLIGTEQAPVTAAQWNEYFEPILTDA